MVLRVEQDGFEGGAKIRKRKINGKDRRFKREEK